MNTNPTLDLAFDELRSHLRRLAIWSALSLVVGLILIATHPNFGTMTAGWAAVNLIIVAASLRGKKPEALGSLREFLAFNLGLNVAYMAVGVCMWLGQNREAGVAIVIQGAALEVLDAILMSRLPKTQ